MNGGVDRKELSRRYKEGRRPMGVYRVRNLRSGRWLIGSSADLPARLNRHEAQLRMGVHANRELQRDWNELGSDAFAFETLDTLEPPAEQPGYDPAADLRALERMWLDKLVTEGVPGYEDRR